MKKTLFVLVGLTISLLLPLKAVFAGDAVAVMFNVTDLDNPEKESEILAMVEPVEGVIDVDSDGTATLTVIFDRTKTSLEKIMESLERGGAVIVGEPEFLKLQ
jgi:allophanate hydrolase subunit 1